MRLKHLIIAVTLAVCLPGIANAQELKRPLTESNLALEVTFSKGRPPAYQTAKGGAWYALFDRVAEWQLPAGDAPVKAVRVVPYVDRDVVRITVSVLRGVKFQDFEERVAAYRRHVDERITVDALKSFGVEPFEIKVVRVAPHVSDFPSILNHTRSVEVVGIEQLVSTFPLYKFTMHNLSEKNIGALKISILVDGKMQVNGMPQGIEGESLIKTGAYAEVKLPLSTRAQATPAGFAPASPPLQQLVIATLVYDDGSYEGDAEGAATFRGFESGRKTELKRLVQSFDSALAAAASPEELRTQVSALSFDVEEADVVNLVKAFPNFAQSRLKSPIEIAIHGVRKNFLDQLKRFQQSEASEEDFRIWLTAIRERYSKWLSRLSRKEVAGAN